MRFTEYTIGQRHQGIDDKNKPSVTTTAAQTEDAKYGFNITLPALRNFLDRLPQRPNTEEIMPTIYVSSIPYRIGMGLDQPIMDTQGNHTTHRRNLHLLERQACLNPETGGVYYAIRASRGGDVLMKVLGKT